MKKTTWILIGVLALLFIVGGIYLLTQGLPTITKTAQVVLHIEPAVDFTLEATPDEIWTPVGRIVPYNASVTSINNFAGEIVFSIEGVPAGVTVTIFPSNTLTLGAGETRGVQIDLNIPLDNSLVGDYTITITAESTQYN